MASWRLKEQQKVNLPPVVAPLMNQLKFDYAAGSLVLVKTKCMGTFRGQVFQNPLHTGIKNSLTLINVHNEATGERVPGHHTFFQNDIAAVQGLKAPREERKKPVETVMKTFVVKTLTDLRRLVELLEEDENVGCYIPGMSMGRFSTPKVIVLNVRYVLIIIPVEGFKGKDEPEFWKILGKFFGRDKTSKIFFDTRGITDYLYNHHRILVKRVFDLQFTELCLANDMDPGYVKDYDPYYRMQSVSYLELLKDYLPCDVPECDKTFLSKFSGDFGSAELSLSEKKYCALKVKYLLKLKYEVCQRIFLPAQLAVEQKGREMIATENVVVFEKRRY